MTWSIAPEDLAETAFRNTGTGFTLDIPARTNIAADMVTRHAKGPKANQVAVVFETGDGLEQHLTFRDLEFQATELAVALKGLGIGRGDRVAIHSVQRPETILAHLATYKLGAIATTISPLTGPEAIAHILADSGARVIFSHARVWQPVRDLRSRFDELDHVIVSGTVATGELAFDDCLGADPGGFQPAETGPEDPALLIYTSGSTGMPKGILHGHRIFHALNASLELFYNLELREQGLVFWTGADWAWVGGLNDVVFPSLAFGHKLIVSEARFDPEDALALMARHRVSHILLTPTALKRLAAAPAPRGRHDLALRTIFTGGESLPGETHRALAEDLGVVCNEGYGMTEVNQMIGNCQRLRPIRPGSMGWEFPGRRVALIDDDGIEVPEGEVGEIAVADTDPTLFLGYWNNCEATDEIRMGRWIRTHDLARKDADGYFWYQGRNDDLIKSAGFRIGPAEIEETLLQHPAVADAGVIGVPDKSGRRGMVVKACIVRAPDALQMPESVLADALRDLVKARLGPHKQPRLVEYFGALPTTSSGKIARAELRRRHQAAG
ncbi:MAG: AMP-binding protein [Paracoccaceae bacterium]|nr:AMP-binding protein [Paracoccaceae bacterium]